MAAAAAAAAAAVAFTPYALPHSHPMQMLLRQHLKIDEALPHSPPSIHTSIHTLFAPDAHLPPQVLLRQHLEGDEALPRGWRLRNGPHPRWLRMAPNLLYDYTTALLHYYYYYTMTLLRDGPPTAENGTKPTILMLYYYYDTSSLLH